MRYSLRIYFLLLLIVTYSAVFSQSDEPKESFKDKVFFGGGFGMFFGTTNYIELSPLVGYRITNELSAGIGITYQYISRKNHPIYVDFNTSVYGGRIFANYLITDNFFPHAEFEVLSLEYKYFDNAPGRPENGRYFYESIFVGAGYRFPVGKSSYITTMLLYNLNYTESSSYDQPYVWRMGFNF